MEEGNSKKKIGTRSVSYWLASSDRLLLACERGLQRGLPNTCHMCIQAPSASSLSYRDCLRVGDDVHYFAAWASDCRQERGWEKVECSSM